ncbi:NnrS family protein [Mesorhizobium sp. M2A.F.Ca.ET.037.01.1.1]|uniref:NnrS family protein n=1 Tax=unclassified Mesorhizobium TaxID=325217 RepID=UPI000F761B7C|nr:MULTISPECIES: NnrS family protein [unclassified Mesorhizobium]RUY11574.1 NnrS family protein [Mesorhizobium sp. M2A.F.Ca.ET.040.01.1.1]AZO39338.1 NnrS family protein [Mesorhizobium sp. M2A.F.Ca.ET.046.03.2.1]RUX08729.1 NnrS family protein [Mesorhizobium sp. M2A.F.Ca.ET.037.01.1.1]RWA90237.1 MAG: NnrS family protein [Mesorhizobium sp.]RWB49599.1 MAG: NnrS family protein [Mesorhizobium sp.]
MAIPRTRPSAYPAILSYGFRPFFLLGSLQAAIAMLLWLPLYYGRLVTFSTFLPVDWHIHELLFGYLPAVVTGFLLTAIPNWTGRLPVQDFRLLALVLLWVAGRAAVFLSAETGWLLSAAIDCSFLLAVVAAATTEIIAGRNWRNLKVLLPVATLFAANVIFHVEAHYQGISDMSRRLGLGAVVVLIMIVGGRIVPSFTRNWLVRENPGRIPASFGKFDIGTIALSAVGLAAWTFFPASLATGALLIAGAVFNSVRLARWAGDRTLGDPLVLILHIAFVFAPLGLLLAGLTVLAPGVVPAAAGIHAFAVGAVACMTLAVMTRASLGYTGRELAAGAGTRAIFVAIVIAAILRIAAAMAPGAPILLHVSAALWVTAFVGYAVFFGGMLTRPRRQARNNAE